MYIKKSWKKSSRLYRLKKKAKFFETQDYIRIFRNIVDQLQEEVNNLENILAFPNNIPHNNDISFQSGSK